MAPFCSASASPAAQELPPLHQARAAAYPQVPAPPSCPQGIRQGQRKGRAAAVHPAVWFFRSARQTPQGWVLQPAAPRAGGVHCCDCKPSASHCSPSPGHPVPLPAPSAMPAWGDLCMDLSIQTGYAFSPRCHPTTTVVAKTVLKPPFPYFWGRHFPVACPPLPLIILSAKAYIQVCANDETTGALQGARAMQPSPQGQTDPDKEC